MGSLGDYHVGLRPPRNDVVAFGLRHPRNDVVVLGLRRYDVTLVSHEGQKSPWQSQKRAALR